MKRIYSIAVLAAITMLASCDKIDNYDKPDTFLTGQVVYNNEPIGVGYNEVEFQLWQPGFGTLSSLGVLLDQDGAYSARLFKGQYKLVFVDGQGPFKTKIVNEQQRDTIFVDLNGDKEMNIEVLPYYTFNSAEFNKSGNSVAVSCNLNQVITDADARDIERVTLYLNNAQFVSDNGDANIARVDGDFSNLSAINMSVEIPESTPPRDYVFARVGVKIAGVEDMLYSQVEKIVL